jgi:hypothetical protein
MLTAQKLHEENGYISLYLGIKKVLAIAIGMWHCVADFSQKPSAYM